MSTASLTQPVYSKTTNAPFALHSDLAELASLFSNKELAVVANVGSLVQPTTRAQYQAQKTPVPVNLFSHSDQQLQWQSANPNGRSSTGWGAEQPTL